MSLWKFKSDIQVDDNTLFTSNGNVGIGTTSPVVSLDVNGTIKANDITSSNAILTNISTANIIATNATLGALAFTNILSSNITTTNLISTNTTNTNLYVQNPILAIMPGIDSTGGIKITRSDVDQRFHTILSNNSQTAASNYLQFLIHGGGVTPTVANNVLTLLGNGNVGIGTTNPGNTLDVNGTLRVSTLVTVPNLITTNVTANSLTAIGNTHTIGSIFTTGGNVGIGITSPLVTLHINNPATIANTVVNILGNGAGADPLFYLATLKSDTTNVNGSIISKIGLTRNLTELNSYIRFHRGVGVTGGFMSFSTSADNERMRLDNTGNLVIGATTAASLFQVVGTGTLTSVNSTNNNTNISTIGTLLVTGTSNLQNVTLTNATGSNLLLTSGLRVNADTTNGGTSGSTTATLITLFRNGISAQSFSNITEFRLGRFSTAGTSAFTQLDLIMNNGPNLTVDSPIMTWYSNTRVGIGTTAPATTLDVNGTISAGNLLLNNITTGTITITNTAASNNLQNVVATNITSGTLTLTGLANLQNVTATNITSGTITVTGLSNLQNLTATNVSAATITLTGLSNLQNVTATSITSGAINITGTSSLQNVTATNITSGTITVTGLSNLQNVTATNITSGTITVTGLSNLQNLTATNVSAATITLTGLATLQNVTATNITSGGFITNNITSGTITLTNTAASNSLQNILATNITTGTITVTGLSNLQNITATNISAGGLELTNYLDAAFNANTLGSLFTTGGNVGIGNTAPGSSLHVSGVLPVSPIGSGFFTGIDSIGNVGIQLNSGTSTSGQSYIDFGFTGNDFRSRIIHSNISNLLNIAVGGSNTPRLSITSVGNVGINTTTPTNTLDISGTLRVTTLATIPNIIANTITSGSISITDISSLQNVTATNITTGTIIVTGTSSLQNITATNITTTNLISTNITSGTITLTGLSNLQNVTATNVTSNTLTIAGLSNLQNVTATNISSATLNLSNTVASNSLQNITTLNITSGSINLTNTAASNSLQNILATNISSGTITLTGLSNLQNLTATNVSAATIALTGLAALQTVTATSITSGAITITGLSNLQNVTATNVSAGTITITGLSNLQNVSSTNLTSSNTFISTPTTNGGTAGSTTATLLSLYRPGVVSQSFLNLTEFRIGRYSTAGTSAFTQLDMFMNNGATTVTDSHIMTWYANTRVGIGTTAPATTLDVNGTISAGNMLTNNITSGTIRITGTSSLQNVTATNITTATITLTGLSNLQTVTATSVTSGAITITGASSLQNVTATNITTGTIRLTGLSNLQTVTATSVTSGAITITGASSLQNVTATTITTGTITLTGLSNLQTVTATSVTSGAITITGASSLQNVTATNITTGTITLTGLSNLQTVTATSITSGAITITGASSLQNVTATNITSATLELTNALDASFNSHTLGAILTTGGNVGIGIVPTATFQINNPATISNTVVNILGNGAGADPLFYLATLKGDTTNVNGSIISKIGLTRSLTQLNSYIRFHRGTGTSDGFMSFSTNTDTERARLDASGNLGIGTSSPGSSLHVTGLLPVSPVGTGFHTGVDASGNAGIQLNAGTSTSGSPYIDFGFTGDDYKSRIIHANSQNNLVFIVGGGTTSLVMNSTGNVVIPGPFTASSNTNTLGSLFTTGGNIGFGTTSPGSGLHITSLLPLAPTGNGVHAGMDSNGNAGLQINAGGSTSGLTFIDFGYTALDYTSRILGDNFNKNLNFYAGSNINPNITIASNGNVGINTTNPGSTLTVNGSLAKNTGTFDIEHPIIEGKRLLHSFIEGPRCDLIYRGTVNLVDGIKHVNLDKDCVQDSDCEMSDGTFEALCANPVKYLHNNTSYSRLKGYINGNILTIECEDVTNDSVDWMVIAERKDRFIQMWDKTNENGYLKTEYHV